MGAGEGVGLSHDDHRWATAEDAVHKALKVAVEVETKGYLWVPADTITFVPPLLSAVFGDGRALFTLTTINDRPAYWIIRGDSRWSCNDCDAPDNAPEMHDMVDEIILAIESEFGSGRWDVDDDDNEVEGDPFPAIDDETGCSWGRMSWPILPGVEVEPHPFVPFKTVLSAHPFDRPGRGGGEP